MLKQRKLELTRKWAFVDTLPPCPCPVFNREKREIMYTNKKYNKADSCFCLSIRSTHIPREIRILTKLFQCHSKGPLLHSKRKISVISSKTQNDYIFKEQILGQFGEIGLRKINKQQKHVTPLRGLLRVTKQGNKADHWKWSYWQGKCSS